MILDRNLKNIILQLLLYYRLVYIGAKFVKMPCDYSTIFGIENFVIFSTTDKRFIPTIWSIIKDFNHYLVSCNASINNQTLTYLIYYFL